MISKRGVMKLLEKKWTGMYFKFSHQNNQKWMILFDYDCKEHDKV